MTIAHTHLQELATGQPILLDLSDECENEDQNFDAWEPDPVDADPCESCLILMCVRVVIIL